MEEILSKGRDLIATCHEHGFAVVVGLAHSKTGDNNFAMEGMLPDLLLITGALIHNMCEKSNGHLTHKEALRALKAVLEDYDKLDELDKEAHESV